MMTIQEDVQVSINTLIEIIYELYLKDLKNGKLNYELFDRNKQSVGKSSTESQTFHQTTFIYEE